MRRIATAIVIWLGLAASAFAAPTCPSAVTGTSPSATSCWPMDITSGTTIADTIDSNPGTLSGSYTLNQNGGLACNGTANGCSIVTPSNLSNPQPMTFYADFAGTSGGMAQLATSSSLAGVPYYVLFLDNQGKLTFGVNNFGTQAVLQSPLTYADGNEHKAVISVGAAGMKLYVDGSLVASRNVSLANYVNGYWFIGGINTANWQLSPSNQSFNGTLYATAWWNGTQLTDAQGVTLTGGSPTPITNSYCSFANQVASLNSATSQAFANSSLTFTTTALQVPGGGSVLPIAPSKLVCKTDSQGNILAPCQVQQGAHVDLSVGFGPTIPMIIPFSTTCDLTAIILSQTDPPEVVSAVAVAGPLFAGATVTNPPAGTIGTATITAPAAFSQTQSTTATVNIGVNGNVQQVIMTGNAVTVALTNFASGASFLIDTTQDGTGGRVPTFTVPAGWNFAWPGGGSQPNQSNTAPGAHNVWQFVAMNGTTLVGTITTFSGVASFPLSATANFNNYSGTNINSLTSVALNPPSGVGVSATCSGTCATTYTYEVSCLDDNSTESLASSGSTSTNATPLDGTHFNVITWSAEATCHSGFNIYGRISGSLGLIGTVGAGVLTFTDNSASSPGAVPPTSNTTGAFNVGGNLNVGGAAAITGAVAITGATTAAAINAGAIAGTTGIFTSTLATGANSGTGGQITFNGSTSGSAALGVKAAAGTPTKLNLPTIDGTAGQVLVNDGSANTSWSSTAHGQQFFGTNGTFTVPAGVYSFTVECWGGGGGGGGAGSGAASGGNGGATSVGSTVCAANGGTGGPGSTSGGSNGGAGGAGTTGTLEITGGTGFPGGAGVLVFGGASPRGGPSSGGIGIAPGGGGLGGLGIGGGGGGGGYAEAPVTSTPGATFSVSIGAAGTAGTGGGANGDAGAAGGANFTW